MAEIAFENGRISNFVGLVTLTLDRVILHSHQPVLKCQISLKSKKRLVDGRTYTRTFETHFIRSTRPSSSEETVRVIGTSPWRQYEGSETTGKGFVKEVAYVLSREWSCLLLWVFWKTAIPREQKNKETQRSRPTRKPKPTKSFKALVIFNILTATLRGGIRELTSPRSDLSASWRIRRLSVTDVPRQISPHH